MKTKLFLLLTCAVFISLQAQTTHHLNWHLGAVSPATDLTINVGDTVEWTWTDGAPHTVQSNIGATEIFNSGTLTGVGQKFSFTFNLPGSNPYLCGIHGAGNMSGTITVQNVLGIDEQEKNAVQIFPNPGKRMLNLVVANLNNTSVEVFDILGKRVYADRINSLNKSIDVSQWNSGVYLVRLKSDTSLHTKRFVKQ